MQSSRRSFQRSGRSGLVITTAEQRFDKVGRDELQIRIDEQLFRWRVAEIYDEWWNAIRRAVEQDERIPSL